jgi:transcriptional regulator with XRE-family HTH domain
VHAVRNEKFLLRFGRNLQKARKSRGITQEELSYKSGLALSQIARIETGKLNTTISTVAVLLKALGAEANELFE